MGSDLSLILVLLAKLSVAFKIRDLGGPTFFIDIETVQTGDGIFHSQRCYMSDILKRAGMVDCKLLAMPVLVSRPIDESSELFADPTRYCSLAGALQYLTIMRSNISYVVN